MTITDYHAKYYAWELTRRFPPDSPERLAGALADAQVDLNPHQVDAAHRGHVERVADSQVACDVTQR